MPELSVIVPTYREAENLRLLVPRIFEATRSAGIDAEIVIVDDASPDDTVAVCAEFEGLYPLRLIVRRDERGLSTAVLRGLHEAAGDVLLVMDADLSHPPEKLPEMYAAALDPANDFVIGSRYVAGGTTADDWGPFRWVNSRVATLLARPLTTALDPMAGFFALRRETFDSAESLDPIGYKIGLELIVKCRCRRVAEVPIHFSDRVHGQSKLSLREQVNYLRHLHRLYAHRFPVAMLLPPIVAAIGTGGIAWFAWQVFRGERPSLGVTLGIAAVVALVSGVTTIRALRARGPSAATNLEREPVSEEPEPLHETVVREPAAAHSERR
jgi:dolichol-phosphate mannosyltransferase